MASSSALRSLYGSSAAALCSKPTGVELDHEFDSAADAASRGGSVSSQTAPVSWGEAAAALRAYEHWLMAWASRRVWG